MKEVRDGIFDGLALGMLAIGSVFIVFWLVSLLGHDGPLYLCLAFLAMLAALTVWRVTVWTVAWWRGRSA